MVKMYEVSEIVAKEIEGKLNNASSLLYLLSNRCQDAKSKVLTDPDGMIQLLEEVAFSLGFVSDSLGNQADSIADLLSDDPQSEAA